MGNKNSGPRRLPTAVHKLRGTLRSNRTNPREPVPPPATDAFDTAPKELHGDAVAEAEWRRLVPLLRRMGVITEAERSVLTALCQQWAIYLQAHASVRTIGMVIEGKHGPVVNPAIAISTNALKLCNTMWGELGLNPSSRTRITALVEPEQPQSKWAGLLS